MSTETFLTVLSIALSGGFVTALVAVFKARPERDSVVVSTAQNASTILQGLNDALYEELERERKARRTAEDKIDATNRRADAAMARADEAERKAKLTDRRAEDLAKRVEELEKFHHGERG